MWRSALFVPATEPRLLEKAPQRGAEAIVLDLEASVVARRKQEARAALSAAVETLRGSGLDVLVRVNMGWYMPFLDIEAVVIEGVRAILVPNAREVAMLTALDGLIGELEAKRGLGAGSIALVPIIESAAGVELAPDLARAPRVVALAFGVEDFLADMQALPDETLLNHTAIRIISAARAGGCSPLVLPESLAVLDDMDRFEAAARRARAFGSEGSFAVHPRQVAVLNACFTPTEAELAQARRIVNASEAAERDGTGAFTLDGRMIDLPIVVRARHLLESARRYRQH